MSLQNLQKIGQLEEHESDAKQVRRMLESAARLMLRVSDWLADNKPELKE